MAFCGVVASAGVFIVRGSFSGCSGRGFLCKSQRSAEDARLGLGRRLLLPSSWRPGSAGRDALHEVESFFLLSQRSTESARPGLPALYDDDDDDDMVMVVRGFLYFLSESHLSTESARPVLSLPDDDEEEQMELHGFLPVLFQSHLWTKSARPAMADTSMVRTRPCGVGNSGSISLLGGVGSSGGRRACAAIGFRGWISRHARERARLFDGADRTNARNESNAPAGGRGKKSRNTLCIYLSMMSPRVTSVCAFVPDSDRVCELPSESDE